MRNNTVTHYNDEDTSNKTIVRDARSLSMDRTAKQDHVTHVAAGVVGALAKLVRLSK